MATRCNDGTAEHIRQHFPRVKLLSFSATVGIPKLRAAAMAEATGKIIAVTEDHCVVAEDWFLEIMKAHQLGYAVVGGAVENGMTDRILDWSVFLCEYSSAMLPVPPGEVSYIPGNNVAYKRAALEMIDDTFKQNFWEFFWHERLKQTGIKFLSVPSMLVIHKKKFGFFYFLSQRFHYSRSFAAMRRLLVPASKRFYYLLASPLLPVVMAWRITRDIFWNKKRLYKQFIFAVPSLAVFLISYAMGEFVGYLLGPGNSLSKVE